MITRARKQRVELEQLEGSQAFLSSYSLRPFPYGPTMWTNIDFLTVWQPQGKQIAWMAAEDFKSKYSRKKGGSCLIFLGLSLSHSENSVTLYWYKSVISQIRFNRRVFRLPLGGREATFWSNQRWELLLPPSLKICSVTGHYYHHQNYGGQK